MLAKIRKYAGMLCLFLGMSAAVGGTNTKSQALGIAMFAVGVWMLGAWD